MENLFRKRTRDYLKKSLHGASLNKHLLKMGYSFEQWVFPPIIDITNVLNGNGDDKDRNNIKFFAPKSNLKWREFSLIHPNNYQKVCENLSTNNNYNNLIGKIAIGSKIFSYSIPLPYSNFQQRSGCQISQWSELQKDISIYASEYPYILIADISNCYHTVYTHTIEWACASAGLKNVGKSLDVSIRRGQKNRTHGLPVGPRITDYLAEIVLCSIDREIEKIATDLNFTGGRYRDNFFMLCKSESDAQKLVKVISICLREYHLMLNDDKTEITRTNTYLNSAWRIDNNLIRQLFGFDEKLITSSKSCTTIKIDRLEAYVESILRLSEKLKHQKGVYEKSLSVLEKIRPERKTEYLQYFGLISRMYQDRIPALPKVLLVLSKLAEEENQCSVLFRSFLKNRFEISFNNCDEFEVLWVSYFMCLSNVKSRKVLKILNNDNNPLYKLMGYFMEKRLFKISHTKDVCDLLWGANNKNNSKVKLQLSKAKSTKQISRILSISFKY